VSDSNMPKPRQAGTAHQSDKLAIRRSLRALQPSLSIARNRASRLTTGSKLVCNNRTFTDTIHPDVGKRLIRLPHMMLKCREHTVCPAMSSNMNQHLMDCRSGDVGLDETSSILEGRFRIRKQRIWHSGPPPIEDYPLAVELG
jgi:hypothetical protein